MRTLIVLTLALLTGCTTAPRYKRADLAELAANKSEGDLLFTDLGARSVRGSSAAVITDNDRMTTENVRAILESAPSNGPIDALRQWLNKDKDFGGVVMLGPADQVKDAVVAYMAGELKQGERLVDFGSNRLDNEAEALRELSETQKEDIRRLQERIDRLNDVLFKVPEFPEKDPEDPPGPEPETPSETFLWKPQSDSDGKLVVLTPASLELTDVLVNGIRLEKRDRANGNRQHWRGKDPGDRYGDNLSIEGFVNNEKVKEWVVPSGGSRTEF